MRSLFLVNKGIATDTWTQVDFGLPDIMVVLIQTGHGKVVTNIYNDTEQQWALHQKIQTIWNRECTSGASAWSEQIIWLGNFNLHHPIWDKERDAHLFMRGNLKKLQVPIDKVAEFDMQIALPKNTPTLQVLSMGNYTRPDNVFISNPLINYIMRCWTSPGEQLERTDHIPIVIELEITTDTHMETPWPHFKMADWKKSKRH